MLRSRPDVVTSEPTRKADPNIARRAALEFLAAVHVYLELVEAAKCGGDLPPCWIMERESHGNIYAVNPGHAGAVFGDPGDPTTHASGKWQFMPSTWGKFAGFPYAAAAPADVQNEKARELVAAEGLAPWACC